MGPEGSPFNRNDSVDLARMFLVTFFTGVHAMPFSAGRLITRGRVARYTRPRKRGVGKGATVAGDSRRTRDARRIRFFPGFLRHVAGSSADSLRSSAPCYFSTPQSFHRRPLDARLLSWREASRGKAKSEQKKGTGAWPSGNF